MVKIGGKSDRFVEKEGKEEIKGKEDGGNNKKRLEGEKEDMLTACTEN